MEKQQFESVAQKNAQTIWQSHVRNTITKKKNLKKPVIVTGS